jgi:putative flippase GtrA
MFIRLFQLGLRILFRLPQFLRFCFVGGIGFVTDAGILSLLYRVFDFSLLWGRLPATLIAVTVTWVLNNFLTFHKENLLRWQSYAAYFVSNLVGMAINYGIYLFCIHSYDTMARWPELAVAAGSIVAAVFNYTLARTVIFAKVVEKIEGH